MALVTDTTSREQEREWEKEDQAYEREIFLLKNAHELKLKRQEVSLVGKWATINKSLQFTVDLLPKCLIIGWVGLLSLLRRPVPAVFENYLKRRS